MADGPGFDGDDPSRVYATPAELWATVDKDKQAGWYDQAVAYWCVFFKEKRATAGKRL